MADQFLGEIRIFAFNFAPKGWAQCNGQLLPIPQNPNLFSLIGTIYGGDGKTAFGLPDLEAAVPVHAGSGGAGPGLMPYAIGQSGGTMNVDLLTDEMPAHTHALTAYTGAGTTADPSDGYPATGAWVSGTSFGVVQSYATHAPDTAMSADQAAVAGGQAVHNNLMPSLVLNFCIALQGTYPTRP